MIQDYEDIRVWDLREEASKHMDRCKVGGSSYQAWLNIWGECKANRRLEHVRSLVLEKVNPHTPALRREIYKKWLAGTERYVR